MEGGASCPKPAGRADGGAPTRYSARMDDFFKSVATSASALLAAYGFDLLGALGILLGGWFLSRWASRFARQLADRTSHIGPTLGPVLATTARVGVLVVAAVAMLNKLGVDTTSILAALGALGIGVGLALKDTLSDLAAGIVILFLRPFEVGEDADINGVEGTVTAVDMFETKLTGFDGVPIVLPNKKVREGKIRNYTRAERRRIDLEVGVAYGADINRAIEVIAETLATDERVIDDPAPLINVIALADSSVNLLVRFWLPPDGWIPNHLDVRRKIKLALDEAGINIPFPQRVVTMVNQAA